MFFKVHVLYIDEGRAVYGWDDHTHKSHLDMIKELCEKRYQFTFTILPLEAVYDVNSHDLDMRVPSQEEQKQLKIEMKMDEQNHTT